MSNFGQTKFWIKIVQFWVKSKAIHAYFGGKYQRFWSDKILRKIVRFWGRGKAIHLHFSLTKILGENSKIFG